MAGALFSGPWSDRWGRKPVLTAAIGSAGIFMFVFVHTSGWLMFPLLLCLGFSMLSTQPVFLAVVQDHFPNHRSVANGLYMSMAFLLRSIALFLVGFLGDRLGLENVYLLGAVLGLLALPGIWLLPNEEIAAGE